MYHVSCIHLSICLYLSVYLSIYLSFFLSTSIRQEWWKLGLFSESFCQHDPWPALASDSLHLIPRSEADRPKLLLQATSLEENQQILNNWTHMVQCFWPSCTIFHHFWCGSPIPVASPKIYPNFRPYTAAQHGLLAMAKSLQVMPLGASRREFLGVFIRWATRLLGEALLGIQNMILQGVSVKGCKRTLKGQPGWNEYLY